MMAHHQHVGLHLRAPIQQGCLAGALEIADDQQPTARRQHPQHARPIVVGPR